MQSDIHKHSSFFFFDKDSDIGMDVSRCLNELIFLENNIPRMYFSLFDENKKHINVHLKPYRRVENLQQR